MLKDRGAPEQGTSIGLRQQVEYGLTHSLFGRRRQTMFWEIRNQRRRRREAGNEEVSSDDDDRDLARVEAEIEGLARNQIRTHTDKELESVFLDPEAVQKRGEFFLQILKKDRLTRREAGTSQVSSDDDEKDQRIVDVQLQGMTPFLQPNKRRNRSESKALESLLLDPEAVSKRGNFFHDMLKDREAPQGDEVEENDERVVDAVLEGMPGPRPILPRQKRNAKQRRQDRKQGEDMEALLMSQHADTPSRQYFNLVNRNASFSVSSGEAAASYEETFRVRGLAGLTARSRSFNPVLAKQIKRQKAILQEAGYLASDEDSNMRSDETKDSPLRLQDVMKINFSWLKRYWQSREGTSHSSLIRQQADGEFMTGGSVLKVDVGLSQAGGDQSSPSMQAGDGPIVFQSLAPTHFYALDSSLSSPVATRNRDWQLVGHSKTEDKKLSKEARKQMEKLQAQLAIDDIEHAVQSAQPQLVPCPQPARLLNAPAATSEGDDIT